MLFSVTQSGGRRFSDSAHETSLATGRDTLAGFIENVDLRDANLAAAFDDSSVAGECGASGWCETVDL